MKLPLAFSLKNRASNTNKDARILNGYIEITGDERRGVSINVLKRPALDSAFDLNAGAGQGLFIPTTPDGDGDPIVIIDDIATLAPTPATKRLSFTVQPSNPALNTAISPSVQVSALNSLGNVVTSFTGDITVALGTNATGATLGGTLTQTAVSGVSTFNNLTLNRSGEDFTLTSTSTGLKSATSNPFDIPNKLAFTVQPAATPPSTTMDPVEVTVQDNSGNTDTAYNGNITISIYSATASGVLSGTLTVAAVNGVASFTNLEIDTEGTYTFKAVGTTVSTANAPALAVSDSFSISNSYSYTLVAQSTGAGLIGYIDPGLGSLTPSTYLGGSIIELTSPEPVGGALIIEIPASTGQGFFTSIAVGATTLLSADASYSSGRWEWPGSPLITAETSYAITITP